MKTVFCIVPMQKKVKANYKGHKAIANDESVMYPINGVLAKMLKKDDEVKVVLLKTINTNDEEKTIDKNEELFKQELNEINEKIGANISYDNIEIQFTEERKEQEKMFKGIIDKIEMRSEIYADITYGPKSVPILTFNALGFAEKFLDADIKYIIYGKAYFDRNGNPYGHEIIDMTALYYLNSITNSIDVDSADEAKKILNNLLS